MKEEEIPRVRRETNRIAFLYDELDDVEARTFVNTCATGRVQLGACVLQNVRKSVLRAR